MIYISWCFGIERFSRLNNLNSIINKNAWIFHINHLYAMLRMLHFLDVKFLCDPVADKAKIRILFNCADPFHSLS